MKKTFRRFKRRAASGQGRTRDRLKQACLAIGLATAWGGEAEAGLTFEASITPSQTITNAWMYYHQNVTSPLWGLSLGTLPANQTSEFSHPNQLANYPDSVWTAPNSNTGYIIIGLYDEGGSPGVVVSMPNSHAINANLTWEQFFARPTAAYQSEAQIVSELQQGNVPIEFLSEYAQYFDPPSGSWVRELSTPLGKGATLVGFSTATFYGTAHVALPEPASLTLIVCTLGVLGIAARANRCQTNDPA
jgi:hypothetical protein